MKFPLQIQFRDMERSDFIFNNIWEHAEKIEHFFDHILSCSVVVSMPHQHQRRGKLFHIQIRLHLPGNDLFVTTAPEKNAAHEDVYVAIRDAFDTLKRRLEDQVRRRRGLVKNHNSKFYGKVVRIFPDDGCGFICTPDNRELYFHENSILNQKFEQLKVGDEVKFSEELGEKGPQVTSMSLVGHAC